MNTPTKSPRKIWQPYNRNSQILVTIVALVLAGSQIYAWQNSTRNSIPQAPAQSAK